MYYVNVVKLLCHAQVLSFAYGTTIQSNGALIAISGFPAALYSYDIIIQSNPSLQNITGFQALQYDYSQLLITNNAVLQSITGFNNLVSISNQFTITNNVQLTTINFQVCISILNPLMANCFLIHSG